MADYYNILGISQSADATEIRAAYKKMAMKYHPDRNAGDKLAEDRFKEVNEAYHVLSDPLKRWKYDSRMYTYQSEYSETYWHELNRMRYRQWQESQRSRYTFDREYFRIQGLAFLVFLIISGFCFGLIHATSYYQELQLKEAHERNVKMVGEVNTLFVSGKFDEAFTMIDELQNQQPLEYYFTMTRDSLVKVIRKSAEKEFYRENYNSAKDYYTILQKYEHPPRTETLERLGYSLYQIGDYGQALGSLKQLFALRPWDTELAYEIGIIYATYMNDQQEALRYFTICKKLFKENLSNIYGEAFEVVMNPADAPDIYFNIFVSKAQTNMKLGNHKEAETDCNWAVFLRPKRAQAYEIRAMAKAAAGNNRGLCKDIATAKSLGADVSLLENRYCR